MMKSGLALYMLLSFVGMAGFGFLAMSPQGDMHGCVAALTRGGECPVGSDSFASLTFHAGAIKGFSTATVNAGFLAIFFLFAISVLAFVHRNDESVAKPFLVSYSRYKQEVRFFASPLAQRIQRWFSLHENSPAVL
ncbi:MAG: hypothetical protein Q7S62_01990 [bacterium]|nr:hypothetical protein [bacterium]